MAACNPCVITPVAAGLDYRRQMDSRSDLIMSLWYFANMRVYADHWLAGNVPVTVCKDSCVLQNLTRWDAVGRYLGLLQVEADMSYS